MTPEAWAFATARAQGLPDHIEDPAALAELAADVWESEGGDHAP
jgi:hypothetical protein